MKLKTKLIALGALDLIERQARMIRKQVHLDALDSASLNFKEMMLTVDAARDAVDSMEEVVESTKRG